MDRKAVCIDMHLTKLRNRYLLAYLRAMNDSLYHFHVTALYIQNTIPTMLNAIITAPHSGHKSGPMRRAIYQHTTKDELACVILDVGQFKPILVWPTML